MHSSRMRTVHLLPVSPSMHCAGGRGVSTPREMSASGGVCSGGSALGVCLLPGDVCSRVVCSFGVSASRGYLPGGVCSGGCLLPGRVCIPAFTEADTPL